MNRHCFRVVPLTFLLLGFTIAPLRGDDSLPRHLRESEKDAWGDPLPRGAFARLGSLRLRHGGPIGSLQFSPDGKQLLSTGGDWMARLWDTATGEQRHLFPGAHATAFTADGRAVAAASDDGRRIIFWDVKTIGRLRTFNGTAQLGVLQLSPDGRYLAAVKDRHLHIWETVTGKQVSKFGAPQPEIQRLLFSSDGKLLATVNSNGLIGVRESTTGKERCQIQGAQLIQNVMHARLSELAFSHDGKTLATGRDDRVLCLWDTATGTELRRFQDGAAALAFSPDGKTLASGAWDGTVSLFNAATGKNLRSFTAHFGAVSSLAYSPDGKVLATGGGGAFSTRVPHRYHHRDCTIRLWDVANGKELAPALGPRADVVALAYSPDGKMLASAGKDHLLRLWRVADGKQIRRLEGHGDTIYSLAFSPNGKALASASEDKSARLWEVATGKVLHELKGHDGGVTAVAFSPDGKTLASAGGAEKPSHLWDASTGERIHMLRGHSIGVSTVAFSPDGRILATGGGQSILLPAPDVDNSIRLWNPRSGQERRRLPGMAGDFAFFTVTFSPDGKTIAAGCINGSIRLWEAATGAERLTIDGAGDGAVVFSPDGRTLAGASPRYLDGTIRLWDALTGKERRLIRGHDGEVYAVAFSPDGKTLASASQDTTVLIWDVADLGSAEAPSKERTEKQLEELWTILAQTDASRAYRAIGTLVDVKQTVPFLRQRLQPIRVTVRRQQIDKLVADLDSDQFAARQRAAAELEKLGDLAEPALRKAIASEPSLEMRRRVEALLGKIDRQVLSSETLRSLRAVEVLEHIGSAEARRVLESLSRGTPGFRLTREARAALERLSRRSAVNP